MKTLAWIFLGVLAAVAGGAIYAQGDGYFWPCEPLGNASYCEEVLAVEGRSLQAMALRPDGFLSLVSRGAGPDPQTPLSLMVVRPQSGVVMEESPLEALPPDASPGKMAIDATGARMALAGLDFFVVTDLEGVLQRDMARGLPEYMGFDEDGRLLVFQENVIQPIPGADQVLAFDVQSSTPPQEGVDEVGALFSQGLNRAISPDGRLVAQRIAGEGRGDVVAIRLALRDRPDAAGTLLSTGLGAGCSYHFIDLAFSLDGRYLAGTFDCPSRWGRESSALVIWRIEDGSVAYRIPTRHDWGSMLWNDQATLMLTRYDPQTQRAGLFRVSPRD